MNKLTFVKNLLFSIKSCIFARNYIPQIRNLSSKMGKRIKKLKKIRLHREGTDTLIYGLMFIVAIGIILWRSFDTHIPFYCFAVVAVTIYCIVINFFRCPIRYFEQDDTDNVIVAPADGRIVVVQEVEENKYFHEPRIMVRPTVTTSNFASSSLSASFPSSAHFLLHRFFNTTAYSSSGCAER